MQLDQEGVQEDDFKAEPSVPNIWTIDTDDEDEPAVESGPKENTQAHQSDDDELEKPSFMRRFKKRANRNGKNS
jgi:hypothetical protein